MKKIVYFLFILLATNACKKAAIVGLQVTPEDDLLNSTFTDTVSIRTYSVYEDSIRTDNGIANRSLLGDFRDPVFGSTQAAIIGQLVLSRNDLKFGANTVLDSAVLILSYTGFYGDSASKFTLQVNELTESLNPEAAYYSTKKYNVGNSVVGVKTFVPKTKDSIKVAVVRPGRTDTLLKVPAQLRIPINTDFINAKIINANPASLVSTTSFTQEFKGLAIRVDKAATVGTGGMMLFDLFTVGKSKLTIYYKSNGERLSFDFDMNNIGAVFNAFTHDYTGTAVAAQIQNPKQAHQVSYVQSLAGVRTKLEFPQLKHLTDSGMIAIHKAELIVPIALGTNKPFKEVERMLIVRADSTGALYNLPDAALGAEYVNGVYDANLGAYKFNIAVYLQDIITGARKVEDLYIVAAGGNVSANRSVLTTQLNTIAPIKLNLSYTNLK